jgi:outer membrane protein assembly factor BamB
VRVTTAGGSSDALELNFTRLQVQGNILGDVAVAGNGDIWTSDWSNPGHLLRVSAATGEILQSIELTDQFGTPYLFNHSGLQFVGAGGMTLGTTAVPAGSLLVFNGYPSPDRVTAVNAATGVVLGSLALQTTAVPANYDLTAGVYDAASGHLFVLESNGPGSRMIELDAVTGAQLSAVTLPTNIQTHAGLAIDPVSGNLWVGSTNGSWAAVEVTRAGVEVRRIDLRTQGVNDNEISGLAFAGNTTLLVASTHGVIYRVSNA